MKKFTFAGLVAAASTFSTAAFAHHPMGGTTPSTMGEGLLSGIGHPIIGMDHLAFVIAVGVAAMLTGYRFLLPLAFVIATLMGTGLHLMSVGLPAAEFIIAVSVALVGIIIFSGREVSALILATLFAVCGLFHGFAYGEAIFGAEATPLVAYLAGFGLTQYAVSVVAGAFVVSVVGKAAAWADNVPARIVGGIVAGVGGLLVAEKALAAFGLAG